MDSASAVSGQVRRRSVSPQTEGISASNGDVPIAKRPRKDIGGKTVHAPRRKQRKSSAKRKDKTLIGQDAVHQRLADGTDRESPLRFHDELELDIVAISPSGEGLALTLAEKGPWVVIVPFCLPGEKVKARIYRNERLHSRADLLEVVQPNTEMRDTSQIKCKYFGSCSGCQYQMLPYETQLKLKRDVVVKAYENYSDIPGVSLPTIGGTIPSPLQYGYRTKITPHFSPVPRQHRNTEQKFDPDSGDPQPEWLKIGFNRVGMSSVMDIEECPIASPTINEALRSVRHDMMKKIYTFKKDVSLILRDSLRPDTDEHICVTDHKGRVRERIGDKYFEYSASSFFQNNNGVLVPLTDYVREAVFPATATVRPTHLVDAYCGAGLFAISLSSHFERVAGIELSKDSIQSANHNAELNDIPSSKCSFRAGDASNIFAAVKDFPPNETVVIIDPPRKGCDENFLKQLLVFQPQSVVYVSCNVHTQARDVGYILRAMEAAKSERRYVLESLCGFDLFPQTAHVESVAVLRLS
ncbi:S-adenosyl-L-methionine-dependent methyltransferase [Fistulina hepatica ATCC 64428]|nr:S-adenosyl-L-methionine-dependent methyltransferase [Fistulina hepatica ATCC 64428]